MKLIDTRDAVGHVLCHDLTQIIPGVTKDARFRKGHVVAPEDIPVLLSIGKENLYVWEKHPGILHEDEAAALLYKAAAGKNIHGTEPKEGKIELIADCDGLLKINRKALMAVNSTPQMMIATIHGDLPVKKGQKLAGTRIIPLVIEQLLLMTVGMADTVMVTTAGEAAVSGVSLVDGLNMLLIQIFAALSTGGAVVVSQYLGRREAEQAVREFQRQQELPVTGETDNATWDQIVAVYTRKSPAVLPAAPVRIRWTPNQVLPAGSRNSHLFLMQAMLQALGRFFVNAPAVRATGVHDAASVAAVRWLQKLSGLPQTGAIDQTTWAYLSGLYTLTTGTGDPTPPH